MNLVAQFNKIKKQILDLSTTLLFKYSEKVFGKVAVDSSGNILIQSSEKAPVAPTVALGSAGTNLLTAGTYFWKVTFVTAIGETNAGDPSASLLVDPTATLGVSLTAIPIGSPQVTARKIYRTKANGSIFLLVATIANNTATTYTDNIADSALTFAIPTVNTTLQTRFTIGKVFASITAFVRNLSASAINVTATITARQLSGGLITSTSAAAVTGTLPTATLLATELGAIQGSVFEFVIDNSAGANIFTVANGTGITTLTAVLTGADTLTVAAGKVGIFRLYFTSATTAVISRQA